MKRGGEKMNKNTATEDKLFDSSYYIERKYMDNFSEEMCETVRKHIDSEIVQKIGYQII